MLDDGTEYVRVMGDDSELIPTFNDSKKNINNADYNFLPIDNDNNDIVFTDANFEYYQLTGNDNNPRNYVSINTAGQVSNQVIIINIISDKEW